MKFVWSEPDNNVLVAVCDAASVRKWGVLRRSPQMKVAFKKLEVFDKS